MSGDDFGNLGDIDRLIRVLSGVVLVGLCALGPETLWGIAGVIPIATGIAGECPVYRLLGISTRNGPHRPSRKEQS